MVDNIYGPELGNILLSGRIVPAGREGNKVFLRTLRFGEEDTGEKVDIKAGDQVIILPGDLVIDTRQIDSQSPAGLGGYAPVANTIWTWYLIVGEQVGYFCYIFALARRLDAAHSEWATAIEELQRAKGEEGFSQRHRFFSSLSLAEMTIISLSRALDMLKRINQIYALNLNIPANLREREIVIREMRNAFEHIDARAQRMINASGEKSDEALSIFVQPDFLCSSILHYRGYELNFFDDVISALLACRQLVMDTVDQRAQGHDKRNQGGFQ